MPTKFSPQQTISREQLNQLVSAADKDLADILESIDSELSMPLYLRESSPADLVVSVGPISITNPDTGRQRSAAPIDGVTPTFAGGTITFSYGGGNLTATPSAGTALVVALGADNWIKVGVSLDSSGNLSLTAGTQGASEAAAGAPASPASIQSIGYISVQTVSSTLQNVPAGQVYQYVGTSHIPDASATESGIVNVTTQTFAGAKHFLGEVGFGPLGVAGGFAGNFSTSGDTSSNVQVIGNTSGAFARSQFRAATASGNILLVGVTDSAFSGSGAITTPNTGYLYAAVGDLYVGATTSKGIKFWTNNVLAAELTSSGNFGVGLNGTPDERFHAEGGTNVKVKLETTSSGNANEGGVDLYNEGSYRGGLRYYESLSGTEGVAISSGAAVRMFVDSSGNVGLGTTAPEEVLHVYDAAGHSMSSDNPGAAARVELFASAGSGDYPVLDLLLDGNGVVNRNAGLRFSMRNSAGNRTHSAIIAAKNLNVTNGAETSALEFYTRSAGSVPLSAMYIDSSQNVGIGTDNPNFGSHSTALTISDTGTGGRAALELEGNSANSNAQIQFYNNSTLAGLIQNRGSGAGGRIGITQNGVDTMTIQNGRVGIGAISPSVPLHLLGTSSRMVIENDGAGGHQSVTIGDSSGNGGFLELKNNSNNVNVNIRSYGNSYFNSGNVGIGSTNPSSERLRVTSQAANSRVFSWKGTGDSRDLLSLTNNGTNGSGLLDLWADSETGTDNNVKVRISADSGLGSWFNAGNVGIGTTNPGKLGNNDRGKILEVAGTVKASDADDGTGRDLSMMFLHSETLSNATTSSTWSTPGTGSQTVGMLMVNSSGNNAMVVVFRADSNGFVLSANYLVRDGVFSSAFINNAGGNDTWRINGMTSNSLTIDVSWLGMTSGS